MKLRCERDVLVEALSAAGRAVSTRNTSLPALSGLHLRASGGELVVTGTDLDLTLQVTTQAAITEEGECVVPARLITDIVRSLPEGSVVIEVEGSEASVGSGKSHFVVRTLEAEEFPQIAKTDDVTATLPASELADALRQVVRAASADDARPVLTGVLLISEQSGMRLVATDSYRLAVRDFVDASLFQNDSESKSVLIPSKALGELTRLLSGTTEVRVALKDKEIVFLIDGVCLRSRLIEGQFPDYRPLIPSNYPNRLLIDRDSLLEAVRRVKLLVRDTTTSVRLQLKPDGIELTVASQEGQAQEEVEAKYEGENVRVGFNPTYLIDGLEALPAGDVLIEILDAMKPVTLKSSEKDDYLYLLMPVRVS